jgi:DNA-binding MarR family transcriptional regulator
MNPGVPESAELASAELASAELASAELPSAELPSAELPSAELAPNELAPAELAPAELAPNELASNELAQNELALGVAGGIERLLSLLRWLTPPDGMSFTAASTLATLDRSGPSRLTQLAVTEGVTQPAMTQLVDRLQDSGLVTRTQDPGDRRVVAVSITDEGSALLAKRRTARAKRLARMLAQLSPEDQAALAAALPAMDVLTSQRPAQIG